MEFDRQILKAWKHFQPSVASLKEVELFYVYAPLKAIEESATD